MDTDVSQSSIFGNALNTDHIKPAETNFLGIPFLNAALPDITRALKRGSAAESFVYVATPNAYHIAKLWGGTEDLAFGLSQAWFLTCDSRVLRYLAAVLFGANLPVITRTELTLHLLRHVIKPDDPVTIIGGDEQLRQDLRKQYGLTRVWLHSAPDNLSADPAILQNCIDFVRANPARFVFMTCAMPDAETLAAHIAAAGGATGVGLCVGSALLSATDRPDPVPPLWQMLCLSWLYGLTLDPWRLPARLMHMQLAIRVALRGWLTQGRCVRLERPASRSPFSVDADATDVTTPARQKAVSIVVLSYDRTVLLERTLRACFRQSLPDNLEWEILVSDNHPDQLARPLVAELQKISPVPLHYLPAPARNIARARNVGVAAAAGRYVAFVDDDEAPEPDWLESYYACLERTGADAAFGPKFPVFATGAPPAWDKKARHYTTDFQVAADQQIGRVGRSGRVLGAGNSCMRVATCLNAYKPFNEKIGAADGEDTELYFRLLNAGRRFVWCPAAAVQEVMPESRLSYTYLHARLKRGSRTSARCRMSASKYKLATHTLLLSAGLAQVVAHGVLFVLTGEFLTQRRVSHRFGMARGLGKLTYRSVPVDFIDERPLTVAQATS